MNKKITLGIVTYKPNANLIRRLECAISLGVSLYIFDNSPEVESIRQFCKQYNFNVVRYMTCGKNVGLGFGISAVCAQAYYDEYSALVFFDQDTVFESSTLQFIEEFYSHHPNITNSHSAIVFNSKNLSDKEVIGASNRFVFKDVLLAINSGSLFYLENLRKIHWHNEAYFVDGVDYEFCLRSNNSRLKIGECSSAPGFDHESEQGNDQYTILGKAYSIREYAMGRIADSIFANARLLMTSIKTKNFLFAVQISRLFAGYLALQFLARAMNRSSFIKRTLK